MAREFPNVQFRGLDLGAFPFKLSPCCANDVPCSPDPDPLPSRQRSFRDGRRHGEVEF